MVSIRKHEVCLICGRPSLQVICPLCVRKLDAEARREHNRREEEKIHEHLH